MKSSLDHPSPTPSATGGFFTTDDGRNLTVTFFLVASLFLLWGVCNGLIDVMDKHFQDMLHLSKSQSAWVQTAHYLGYAIMALPAGLLARSIGYKGGIIFGLSLVSVGGFWFIAATHIASFWSFLLGVCIIAMGLTVLETVANPYTTVLGAKQHGAFRINVAQCFNGVGWMFGPVIGGAFFYSAGGAEAANKTLYIPYVAIAIIVLVMAVIFFFANVPDLNTSDEYHVDDKSLAVTQRSIWTHPHFVGGVFAQFLYVAAQAGIFSFFINYMIAEVPPISHALVDSWFLKGGAVLRNGAEFINEQGAARLQGVLGFGLFFVGRLIGSAILRRARPHRVLAAFSAINVVMCAIVMMKIGWVSVIAVLLTFFFMSISFPTIFALGIYGLGTQAKKASAFIVMAILGGAIMPKVMGHLGDLYNMSISFLMPLCCFIYIAIYGFSWSKLSKSDGTAVAPRHGH
ncbi:MAG TPA: MFS transporter [Opitutaceae bacterium]|nr:MFS transporter [Opitutaceae bacterium]